LSVLNQLISELWCIVLTQECGRW